MGFSTPANWNACSRNIRRPITSEEVYLLSVRNIKIPICKDSRYVFGHGERTVGAVLCDATAPGPVDVPYRRKNGGSFKGRSRMTITVQISRQKLETILFNAFHDLVICRETPLETPGGETRWLSGVELQSVRIQQGTTGEGSTRVALATGETPAGTSVTQSFTVPEAYAEFDYRISTIRDTEVNAEQYENVESSVVTVRKPFYRVSVSSAAISVITLGTESYDPTYVPNTNTKVADLFRYTGSYGGTIILPRGYKNPNSIEGLSKSNVGYRLSPDGEALVIRVDYTPSDAVETGPNSGTVPAWESFYEQPGRLPSAGLTSGSSTNGSCSKSKGESGCSG